MLMVAGGLLWMGQLDQGSSLLEVGVRIGVVGLGFGGFQAAAYSLLVKSLPAGRMGTGRAASPSPRRWGPWSRWPSGVPSSP